jgi:hypothetical protein
MLVSFPHAGHILPRHWIARLHASVGIEKPAQIVQCTTAEFIVEYLKKLGLNGKNYAQD